LEFFGSKVENWAILLAIQLKEGRNHTNFRQFKTVDDKSPYFCPMKPRAGRLYRIHSISDPVLAARLVSLGIYPGCTLTIIQESFLGGACYLAIENGHYALREEELAHLVLEPCESQGEGHA
jgi:Fe2+ transport system protein FeoA